MLSMTQTNIQNLCISKVQLKQGIKAHTCNISTSENKTGMAEGSRLDWSTEQDRFSNNSINEQIDKRIWTWWRTSISPTFGKKRKEDKGVEEKMGPHEIGLK